MEAKKFTNISSLVLMLMLMAGLPILTKLVSQNQENRSKASAGQGYGSSCSSNSDCSSGFCTYTQTYGGHKYTFMQGTAVCSSSGSDNACTSLGGSCTASYVKNVNNSGEECTTSDGSSGQVMLNLCLRSTARCCVPSSNSYQTAADEEAAQPTTAQPTTAAPTTAAPTTAQPTTAQPTTAQPTTAAPTTAQPTTAAPTTSLSSPKLSFRIAFSGVVPEASCADNFKTVSLIVGIAGTDIKENLTVNVNETGEKNSHGYAIFGADNVALSSSFAGATNIYVRVKGQVHLKMYYCVSGQTGKSTSQVCSVAINGTVNNFYEYPMLAGDVDQDGAVTVLDFSEIKNNMFETGCGYTADLNGDGVINDFDLKLAKVALEEKYDE